MLLIVIGYDLVSYLLHYLSAHCVTFKELFLCKSSYLVGDIEINLQLFSLYIKFSVKAVLSVGTPSLKTGFEQMYSDYRISGEKSFVSRLNNSLE